jgi:diaminohydroxyphosphoribosylaminopyrimidine deaminase/5-amino-6-(5-phosphoribosylamino)uracil reductase
MSLVEHRLADRVLLYVAPRVLGDSSAPAVFSGRASSSMADAIDLEVLRVDRAGDDVRIELAPPREDG